MEVIFDLIRTIVAPVGQVLLALTGAYLITLWVVLIIWTFRDIESRSRSVVTQVFATLLVVFFFLPGLLLYVILRPKETLDEAFQRALQEEYLLQDLEELPLCPSCRHYVQSDFVLCPHCHTRLRENCPSCVRLVDVRWDICPYCSSGLPDADESQVETRPATTPALRLPAWVNPALEQLRTRVLNRRAGEETNPDALTTGPLALGSPPAEAVEPVITRSSEPEAAAPAEAATPAPTHEAAEPAPRNGHHEAAIPPETALPPLRQRRGRVNRARTPDESSGAATSEPAALEDIPANGATPTETTERDPAQRVGVRGK